VTRVGSRRHRKENKKKKITTNFTLAAREPAHGNGCGRVPKRALTLLLYTVANIITLQ
jgi:hypothetical protein